MKKFQSPSFIVVGGETLKIPSGLDQLQTLELLDVLSISSKQDSSAS